MGINKYSQPVQLQPVDVFDEDVVSKALTIKQLKYDQGLQNVQLMLDQTSRLDIVNSSQKQYLEGKMKDVLENVDTFSGIDFSNNVELGELNKVISSVTDDKVVQNALLSTSNFRKYIKSKENLWEDPNKEELRSTLLRGADEKLEANFLNSKDVKATWNKTIPSYNSGFDKEVYTASNEIKTTTGTRYLENGKYKQDYEFRSKPMMLKDMSGLILNNPEHLKMLNTEFDMLYDTPEKQMELFKRGSNVEKLKQENYLKGLEAQLAIDNHPELKRRVNEAKQELQLLDNTTFSEQSARKMYGNQRLLSALAPEINIDQGIEVNQAYYKDIQLGVESRRYVEKSKKEDMAYELKVADFLVKNNINIPSDMSKRLGINSNVNTNRIVTDYNTVIPENGENVKNYSQKMSNLSSNAKSTLKGGLLSIVSKGNTKFYNELKNTGVLKELDKTTELGVGAIQILEVLNERVVAKSVNNELLSPLEQDFVGFYDNYQESMVLVDLMKNQKENLITPILEKRGYKYEDYIQYKIDNKDEKGILSNIFSKREGLGEYVKEIDEEIESIFGDSSLNTFNLNNKSVLLNGLKGNNAFLHNEIKEKGLQKNGKQYYVNDESREDGQNLSLVDFEKMEFLKYNPNTNQATVTVTSGSGVNKNISDYTFIMSDEVTAKVSNSIFQKPYNSSYYDKDEELDKYLKSEKSLTLDGKEVTFSLHSITGLPLSNRISYTYDDNTQSVNVSLGDDFGTFIFAANNKPKTIKDAKGKLTKAILTTYDEIKRGNPKATHKEILDYIIPHLKEKHAYR
jgi:hypothetical protein